MKKKVLAVILCLTFVFAAFGSMTVFAATSTGAPEGGYTQNDDEKLFRVWTAEGLLAVKNLVNKQKLLDYDITVMCDIDMSTVEWDIPIGSSSDYLYRGTFDGQGHTITGLHTAEDYNKQALGLIGYAANGCVVKNVNLVGVNFTNAATYSGGIIGQVVASTELGGEVIVENCTVTGKIATTANYAGGLVGCMRSFEKHAVKVQETDENGQTVEKSILYPPTIIVRNCAVNMELSSTVNFAAGVMGGDSFTHDNLTPAGTHPVIEVENVFVTGKYSSAQGVASGFIGYFNLAEVTLKNCYSAAELDGNRDVSGSFFGRVRKCALTVENCYSLSDYPFAGEIENLGTFYGKDGEILDGVTIVNSYAMKNAMGDAKVCAKLTLPKKPVEPAEGADFYEFEKYEFDLAAYNELVSKLVIVNIDSMNYGIDAVANMADAVENFDMGTVYSTDIILTIDSIGAQTLLQTVKTNVLNIFAGKDAQLKIWNDYYNVYNCTHAHGLVQNASARYIAASATCTSKAKYFLSCPDCGRAVNETFEYGEFGEHVMSAGWRYVDGGETHFHQCTVCKDYLADEAPHTFGEWEVVRAATTTRVGKEARTCSVCEAEETRDIPKLDQPTDNPTDDPTDNPKDDPTDNPKDDPTEECEHIYDDVWSIDKSGHWYACTECGKTKKDFAVHTFGDWIVEQAPSELTPGKMIHQCSACKYTEESIIYSAPESGCMISIGGTGIVMLFAALGAVALRKKED